MTLFLLGLLILAFISLLAYRNHLKSTTKIEAPNGINSLEEISLGGLKQWIFVRSENKNNPILLFLHGGPGEPMGGMPSSRKYDSELIKHFTIVHWDQLGAGKSYNKDIPVNKMSLDSLVENCSELIDHLRSKFNKQKVILVAHSGGTTIGIKTAYKYPEKIHAYVGVSQVVNDYEQQRISYNFIVEEADKSGDKKAQSTIKAFGPPPYDSPEKIFKKARYVVKYGGFICEKPIRKITSIMLNYLTSPEYSLSEGFRTLRQKGLYFTMNARWEEICNVNFTNEIDSIGVPVYFFQGKLDMIMPTVLIEGYYSGLKAKNGKQLIFFEHSAHIPMLEEKEKYEDLLVNVVLKESVVD